MFATSVYNLWSSHLLSKMLSNSRCPGKAKNGDIVRNTVSSHRKHYFSINVFFKSLLQVPGGLVFAFNSFNA